MVCHSSHNITSFSNLEFSLLNIIFYSFIHYLFHVHHYAKATTMLKPQCDNNADSFVLNNEDGKENVMLIKQSMMHSTYWRELASHERILTPKWLYLWNQGIWNWINLKSTLWARIRRDRSLSWCCNTWTMIQHIHFFYCIFSSTWNSRLPFLLLSRKTWSRGMYYKLWSCPRE